MKIRTALPTNSRGQTFRFILPVWIVTVTISFCWNWYQENKSAFTFAEAEARASFNKDLVYRRWAAKQGGFYVPPSAATPPNPYLAHISDRDIETTTGKRLTLVNPAYMTRQVHELGKEQYGTQGHITSLIPFNPKNAADAWETAALHSFEKGEKEIASLQQMNDETYLRYMRPVITEPSCLKCHAGQGYKEGEIRGGISISIPFSRYAESAQKRQLQLLLAHLLIGGLGVAGLWQVNKILSASEKTLQESEARIRAITETAQDGIIMINAIGKVSYWNPAAERIFGFSNDEAIGAGIHELIIPQQFWEQHQKALARFQVAGGGAMVNRVVEMQASHKDGHEFPVELALSALSFQGEWHAIGVARDISDRKRVESENKQLQEQLIHGQKMQAVGTLAGGIAHDFNNILGSILGYAELAKEDIPADSFAAQYIGRVLEASHRATTLVKQILAFSRQTVIEKSLVNPARLVIEVINLLRPSLPATIAIKQDIHPPTKSIFIDPAQFHQILMNLCTNAFHAMEQAGGTLEISLKDLEITQEELQQRPGIFPGSFVELSVSDTGSGIAPEIWGRIYDPFFTTKGVGKGTGMGLSIIHGIVASYGGFITGENNRDCGAVFRVYFPAVDGEDSPENREVDAIPSGSERILLIDDEEMLAELGKTMLESLGYKVTALTNSSEALTIFRKQPNDFDAIITDQTMPGMTGVELSRRVQQIDADVPIILVTGNSALVTEEQAMPGTIKGVAMKPLSKRDIASLLRKVLDEHQKGT